MSLNFQKATPKDAATISALADKIWREHYPAIITLAQIDFMLKDRYSPKAIAEGMAGGEEYFLAYVNNEPVAYADMEKRQGDYFLHKFYVDVSKHRGGIGHQFFHYLLQQMKEKLPMRLQVNRQNYKAINFYFKEGFIIESVGDFDIGGGYYMNDFVMVRNTTSS